jgi:hypothetical protein
MAEKQWGKHCFAAAVWRIAQISSLVLLPGSAVAQLSVTTEILSGYLLPESNYLVTRRPVIQTDLVCSGR